MLGERSYSNVTTGFLTSDERDTTFWCGFHLDDHRVLQCYGRSTVVSDLDGWGLS
jgi:hypothetical protein